MRKAPWLLLVPIVLALAVAAAVFAVGARAVDRGFDVIEYRQQSPYYQALALRAETVEHEDGFAWRRLLLVVAAIVASGAWTLGRAAPFLREWRLARRPTRRAQPAHHRSPVAGSLPALPPGDFGATNQGGSGDPRGRPSPAPDGTDRLRRRDRRSPLPHCRVRARATRRRRSTAGSWPSARRRRPWRNKPRRRPRSSRHNRPRPRRQRRRSSRRETR